MQLNFKTFGSGFPLVILHGLFGSLDNWQTIAKKLAQHFKVYIIDQRNHGKSPHSDEFNYPLLSADLFEFFVQCSIAKAYLIGHSMGGKTVMKFALDYPDKVSKLIVVDVAPVQYEDRHHEVFEALFAVDVKNISAREDAEKILRMKLSNDETTVQFLMKGLQRAEKNINELEWKFNIESLHNHYTEISGEITSAKPFKGETLFIKGEKSSYLNTGNYNTIETLFPNNHFTEIKGAGHWVHAEKPAEFIAAVSNFLN